MSEWRTGPDQLAGPQPSHLYLSSQRSEATMIPGLPPAASSWTLTSTAAAAISYADRGTSAIAASGILADLGWTESQLGTVQSSFFLGYGLTQGTYCVEAFCTLHPSRQNIGTSRRVE